MSEGRRSLTFQSNCPKTVEKECRAVKLATLRSQIAQVNKIASVGGAGKINGKLGTGDPLPGFGLSLGGSCC